MADSTKDDLRTIRNRLRSYERKLRKEKAELGCHDDSGGRRYHIGPHYQLLGDDAGALAAFEWFEREFPDDIGEPGHLLCWALALHRAGNEVGAARKLRQTTLSNLYLIPHLLGAPLVKLDIQHGSNHEQPGYLHFIPVEYLALWTYGELKWAAGLCATEEFALTRVRFITIAKALDKTPPGPERSRLVEEMSKPRG